MLQSITRPEATRYRRDYKTEAEVYKYALKLQTADLFTTVEAGRAIALSKAKAGDHWQAIDY